MIADGSAISRVTFSDLFGIFGTIYGVGDGSTTFNLPDLRDTFIRGTTVNLGVTGGTASHNHIDDPPNVLNGAASKSHTHSVNPPAKTSGFPLESSRKVSLTLAGVPKDVADDNHRHTTNSGSFTSGSSSHTHDVNIGPHPTETTGNQPPFLNMVMIIRAQ